MNPGSLAVEPAFPQGHTALEPRTQCAPLQVPGFPPFTEHSADVAMGQGNRVFSQLPDSISTFAQWPWRTPLLPNP